MIEIGQRLKRARQEKGITLEEIASRTRINLAYLQNMEQGKFDFLPAPYVIAFTKSFANYVGLDGNEVVASLQVPVQTPVAPKPVHDARLPATRHQPPAKLDDSSDDLKMPMRPVFPYLREVLLGAAIVLAMALLLIWVARSPSDQPEEVVANGNSTSVQAGAPEITIDEMAKQAAEQAKLQAPPEPEILTLEARIDADVWMRVVADDSTATDAIYPRGSVQTWQAETNFRMRVGNAGVVTLILNGKNLGKIGEPGHIANLLVNREGIAEKQLQRAGRQQRSPRAATDTSGT
jgi:cytoskeletal protein RodZ